MVNLLTLLPYCGARIPMNQIHALVAILGLLAGVLPPALANAQVIHHWEFEDTPGFLENSVGVTPLTNDGAAEADLPGSGRGSQFVGLPPGNATAADFAGTGEHLSAVIGTSPANDFTIEVFAHFDSLSGTFGEHIVGTALDASNANIGWALQYRFNTGTLQLVICLASACELIDSDLPLETGIDYYIAAAFDLQNAGGGEVTFYLQDLTNEGDLQIVTVPHASPSRNLITTVAIGATASNSFAVEGLIDEVRLAHTVLPESELLIHSAGGCPETPTLDCTPLAKRSGSKIDIKSNGKLTWQWKKGSATAKPVFGNPAASDEATNYSLCIYDEVESEAGLVAEYTAPGGDDWKEKKNGFNFKSKGAGLTKMILRAGTDKKAKIVDVKGKKLDVPDLPLAQDPRVIVQLINDDDGCWETEHSGPAKKNGSKGFSDKAD